MIELLCLINTGKLTGNRFGVTAPLAKMVSSQPQNGFVRTRRDQTDAAGPKARQYGRAAGAAYASVRGGRPLPRVFQLPQLTRARL